jgi:hypothetical protein
MIPRKRIAADDEIAERLYQLGCSSSQVARHIQQLNHKRPEPRHHHLSERDNRWIAQLRERPLLMDGEGNGRLLGWKKLVGRV